MAGTPVQLLALPHRAEQRDRRSAKESDLRGLALEAGLLARRADEDRVAYHAAASVASLAGFAPQAFGQARTKLRVGYLHTPAVDGQIWLGQQSGAWTKRGLDLELIQFTTGLELFQAMIGGSLDMLATGAVIGDLKAGSDDFKPGHRGGRNIRFGIRPDRLTLTHQLWADVLGNDASLEKELRSLNAGVPYWAAVEAFNESGVSKLTRVVPIR